MINAERALALLDEVVQAHGEGTKVEYRNALGACQYWVGDGPSCLIGHALWRSGVFTIEEIQSLDTEYANACNLIWLYEERIDPVAAEIFEQAQQAQDSGTTWGSALQAGRNWYTRYKEDMK